MRFLKLVAIAVLFVGTQLWADVSYITGFKFEPGSGLPPGVAESMLGSVPAMPVVRTRMKGKRSATQLGDLRMIMDSAKREVTLLDPASKTFATAPFSAYLEALGKPPVKSSPELEKMLSGIEVATSKSDRTDVIEGIKVGERVVNLSMTLPLPPMPTPEGQPPGPKSLDMKVVMHLWTALPSEVERVPALRELNEAASGPDAKLTGRDFVQQFGQMLPGGGQSMTKLFDELAKEQAFPLRTEMEFTMPGLMEMMAQLAPTGGAPGGGDPKGPLMTMVMELTNLSTDPIDDAFFEVPKDYKPAAFADIIKKLSK